MADRRHIGNRQSLLLFRLLIACVFNLSYTDLCVSVRFHTSFNYIEDSGVYIYYLVGLFSIQLSLVVRIDSMR